MRIPYRARFCGLALTLAVGLLAAQDLKRVHFGGVINDYTPSTVSGGPYEMRGNWSLDVGTSSTAEFTATLTMETSDYGVFGAAHVDPANPATRNPHTHHIAMTANTISYDTSVCPATTGAGVVFTGPARIAGNGSPAPFESKGSSTLQVCIMGGSAVRFSNVTLVFSSPANSHFGTQPIHGVVSRVSMSPRDEADEHDR